MVLRPFSDHRRGLFVSVDGPSGAGKSTIVAHLTQLLVADGEHVHTTAEPSTGPIGRLARELTEEIKGPALACLYSADRYHHLGTEIRPHLEVGEVVGPGRSGGGGSGWLGLGVVQSLRAVHTTLAVKLRWL